MKQKCWYIHCEKHDKDVGFGLECFACPDVERPKPNYFHPDARLCVHERYTEEIEREI